MRSLASFLLLLTLLLSSAQMTYAQAPAWQTVQVASQNPLSNVNYSQSQYAALDAAGNIIVAGTFVGTLTLGSITLTNAGGEDVYVAKWSPATNTFVWAQRLGGPDNEGLGGIAVSGTSIYVSGAFRSTTLTLGNLTLANSPSGFLGIADEGFLVKLTDAGSTGTFVWAQRLGGTDSDSALGVAASGNSVYVVGSFLSNPFTLGALRLTNQGQNGFVAKLIDNGSSGTFTWAQQTTRVVNPVLGYAQGNAELFGVTVQGSSVYTVGQFSGPIRFGGTTLTATGPQLFPDVVVARLTDAGSSGSFVAAVGAGGADIDVAYCLAAAGSQLYVSGRFRSPTLNWGSTILTNAMSGGGGSDAFVGKLNTTGTGLAFGWAQRLGGAFNDDAFQMAVSGTAVFVAGSFSGAATFGSQTRTSVGYSDIYLAKLLDAGSSSSVAWVQQAGGLGYDYGSALVRRGQQLYVGGSVTPVASFGTLTVNSPAGRKEAFVASLTDPTLTSTRPAWVGPPLTVYPNPAHGTVTVSLPAGGSSTSPLALLDALGRTVRRYPAPAGTEATLDLRGLPAGVYVLRSGASSQRLAIE